MLTCLSGVLTCFDCEGTVIHGLVHLAANRPTCSALPSSQDDQIHGLDNTGSGLYKEFDLT